MSDNGALQLILDLRCNSRCVLCGAAWPYRPRLQTEDAIARLQRGRALGLDEVVLSGGEVTLRPDLMAIIAAARAVGYQQITLLTNGRRLAIPDYVDQLVAEGVTAFGTSLHGATETTHERITRAAGSYREVLAGIEAVIRHPSQVPLSVNYVIGPANEHELSQAARLLAGQGVRNWQVTYVIPVGRARTIFRDPTVVNISATIPHLRHVFQESQRPAAITLAFFPACILDDLVCFSGDFDQPPTYFADLEGNLIPIESEIAAQGLQTKFPACGDCPYNDRCGGFWTVYVAERGSSEFVYAATKGAAAVPSVAG